MDIIQEHIDLLRAQFDILQRMHGPVRKYRAGRNCQKGYNCGGSCIRRKTASGKDTECRKALEGEAKNFSEWMVQKMSANIGAVVGEAPVDKHQGGGNEIPDTVDRDEFDRLVADGYPKASAQMWADTSLSWEEKNKKDAENRAKSNAEYERLVSEGVGEDEALLRADDWMRTDEEKFAINAEIEGIDARNQAIDMEGKVRDRQIQDAIKKEQERKQRIKEGKVKKSQLTADQISDFQKGVDQVVRKKDGTYVVSGTGQYKDTKIQSDVMDDRVKSNIDKLTDQQLSGAIRSVRDTPYLSREGKIERINYMRELQQKRSDERFQREQARFKDQQEQLYEYKGEQGTLDQLSKKFPEAFGKKRRKGK